MVKILHGIKKLGLGLRIDNKVSPDKETTHERWILESSEYYYQALVPILTSYDVIYEDYIKPMFQQYTQQVYEMDYIE